MRCEKCQSRRSRVVKTRTMGAGERVTIHRRRQCLDCGHRFTTVEITLVRILDVFVEEAVYLINREREKL